MKYYLVNFLVFEKNIISENSTIAISISMDRFDAVSEIKTQLCSRRKYRTAACNIVIKNYKQISEDIYLMLHPFVKENEVQVQANISCQKAYKFQATNYSV